MARANISSSSSRVLGTFGVPDLDGNTDDRTLEIDVLDAMAPAAAEDDGWRPEEATGRADPFIDS